MTTEFWRWREYAWASPDLDWRDARLVTAGVDVGSVSSQAVILADSRPVAYASIRTGSNSPGSAMDAMGRAMGEAGLTLADIHCTLGMTPTWRAWANTATARDAAPPTWST